MSTSTSFSVEETLKQALSERDAGRLDEAERLYRSVLKENPQDAEAQKALHKLLKGQRKPAKGSRPKNKPARKTRLARAGSVRAPETIPPEPAARPSQDNIQALISLYQAGELREAETQARRLIKKYPRTLQLFDVLTGTLIGQGKAEEAVVICRQSLKIKPDYAVAHNNLGAVLSRLGRSEEAIASCRQALKIKPDYAEAHINLGLALNRLGKYQEAVANYQSALKIKPDSAKAHSNLGAVLTSLGRPKEAVSSYLQALKIKPDYTTALMNLGYLYERTNQLEEATECIQKALQISPDDPTVNRTWAVLLKRQGKIKEAIDTLEPFLNGAFSNKVLAEIHDELGQLYDREQDSRKAFHHFVTANDLQAGSELAASFSKELFLSEVQQSADILALGRGVPRETFGDDQGSERLSFLIGFPRSGTTLLDQILDSHPGLQVMDEKPALHGVRARITNDSNDYPAAVSDLGAADIQKLRDCYFQHVNRHVAREPGTLLVDKLPLNISLIPLIARLFPDARIIIALRHPCDVVLSNFMQHYKMNNAMANFFTLADAAHCYAQVMGLWLKCATQLPMTYHTVKYESVVSDFDKEINGLLQFLGVDWDDAVLDYSTHAKQKEIINTPSYQAVTEPINTRAKYRWVRYREQLEPVLDDLLPFIEAFGYAEAGAAGEVS